MSTQPEKKENKLNELYEQGKAKGTMTYDEIITKLSTTDIDPDQFDTVLETLEAMGVEVIRDANSAEGPQTPEAAPEIDDIDLSMPTRKRSSASPLSRTARRPSACWPRPTCAWSYLSPSAMWAVACCSWISFRRATWA